MKSSRRMGSVSVLSVQYLSRVNITSAVRSSLGVIHHPHGHIRTVKQGRLRYRCIMYSSIMDPHVIPQGENIYTLTGKQEL